MSSTIQEVLRGLADMEPGDVPVLSAYLDMRPQATGERPALRSGLVVLKDRLREIEKIVWPRGPAFDSFTADAARINQYVDEALPVSAQGLAIFASTDRNLFEVVEAGVPFENEVAFAPVPDLFQLARFSDQQETAVVGVVDTNTARLFVLRAGFLEDVGGPSDEGKHFKWHRKGALNQARYQRHIKNHRLDFAQEAAAEIERLVDREGATRLILAGDEVSIPLLRAALSPRIAEMAHDEVLRFDIRVPGTEVERTVAPILAQAEAEDSSSLADQLINAVEADMLGVIGVEQTRAALEQAQVDVLLLTEEAEVDAEMRNKLIRLAMTTGADVEVVERHDTFQHLGGMGALLRYRHDVR